jgi:hypothetical protein
MTEWIIEFAEKGALEELARSLRNGPMLDDEGTQLLTERAVDFVGPLRVDVLSDEHPPPHFRVTYQGETANYRISDCAKINGGLDRFDRNIRKWHTENKQWLIDKWNEARPDDCPVGQYRE